jgi:FkbM family methyltransferase
MPVTITGIRTLMKQAILGTPFGRIALALRDKYEIVRAAWSHPENVGLLANDRLATRLITHLCPLNGCFVDVGAHIGSVVAAVARHDPSVRIIAIEAIPEKAKRLQRKFPRVEIHGCAVGERTGNASFFVHLRASGFSSLGRPQNRDGVREISVRTERLDDLVSAKVDAVKIDVEGAELGVLRGAERILAGRPIVMFESGPQEDDGLGYSREAIYEFLAARGFSLVIPNRLAHNDDGLSLGGFLEGHLYPFRTTNYFAVPSERRVQFRDLARRVLGIAK